MACRYEQPLSRGKWLATHTRVDVIKNLQAGDIRHPVDGDRIADCQGPALRVGERWPRGKVRTVRIARSRKIDPVAGHLLGDFPVGLAPAPGLLVQMIEDIPERGEMTRAPTFIHRTDRERRLLSK